MSKLIEPVKFHHYNYEKLTDDMYYLGSNAILRLNVVLARKAEDGTRNFYHTEFMYESNKYCDTNQLISMRRSFSYFLTIENIRAEKGALKEGVMITPPDMYYLLDRLDYIRSWFNSDSGVFALSKDKIIRIGSVQQIVIPISAGHKFIAFEPIVIEYERQTYEGVRMYLNSSSNYSDMTVDKFMGFAYLMSTTNMFMAAQMLLAYHGRPEERGYNMVSFTSDPTNAGDIGYVSAPVNRQIASKTKQKSFFDKMNDL